MPWEDKKRILETRLATLETKLREIEARLDQPANRDDEDRATEREEDEVLERMGLEGKHEIEMIRAALRRIDEGEYGTCRVCGEAIETERLDLLPHTPFCRRCAT